MRCNNARQLRHTENAAGISRRASRKTSMSDFDVKMGNCIMPGICISTFIGLPLKKREGTTLPTRAVAVFGL